MVRAEATISFEHDTTNLPALVKHQVTTTLGVVATTN